jgi:hypothetical protein
MQQKKKSEKYSLHLQGCWEFYHQQHFSITNFMFQIPFLMLKVNSDYMQIQAMRPIFDDILITAQN